MVDGVLHREDQDLHHHADPEPKHEHGHEGLGGPHRS